MGRRMSDVLDEVLADKPAGPREFDKVDRALEIQVIDWLQFADFADDIRHGYGDADKAQLALTLIVKRKAAYADLKAEADALCAALDRAIQYCEPQMVELLSPIATNYRAKYPQKESDNVAKD